MTRTPRTQLPGLLRAFLSVAIAVLVVTILARGQEVLLPIALAVMAAFILTPPVRLLERWRLGRLPSVIVVLALALSLVATFGYVLSMQFNDFATHMPRYAVSIKAKLATLRETRKSAFGQIQETVDHVSDELDRQEGGAPATGSSAPSARVQPVSIVPSQPNDVEAMRQLLVPVLSPLVTAGIVLILTTFILVRREDLRNRLIRLVGSRRITVTTRAMDDAGDRISQFLFSQSLINAGFGVCIAIGLLVIGVPYAVLWGVSAALLRFVPYLGSLLALIMPAALAFVASPGWAPTVETIALFLALDAVTANVIEPVLIGTNTGLSSLALLVSALFWTWLWGPVGLILSTPIAVCLVVIGKHVAELEFLEVLLGDDAPLDAAVTFYQRLLAGDEAEATAIIDHEFGTRSRASVFDEVIVPTLVRAGRDQLRGDISTEEEQFVVHTIRDALRQRVETVPPPVPASTATRPRRMLGIPARNESDELALEMLSQLLGTDWGLEQLSTAPLASELLLVIADGAPDVLCICSVPPGGLTHARYLSKRIRKEFPDLPIWILRPEAKVASPTDVLALTNDGAQQVGTSFADVANQLTRFVFVPRAETVGADAAPAVLQTRDAPPVAAA